MEGFVDVQRVEDDHDVNYGKTHFREKKKRKEAK